MKKPLFQLGQIVATPDALAELGRADMQPIELLTRHVSGDWGDLDAEDKAANERALKDGSRVFSSYKLHTGVKIWVITEAWSNDAGDRESTCLLLPDNY